MINVEAQNFGLTSPQDQVTLPKSAVQVVLPQRKQKEQKATRIDNIGENEWKIIDGWELAEASKVIASDQSLFNKDLNTSAWYNAIVPGTVLTTFVEQGIYPDPYYGVNNLSIPDSLCRIDWWYRTTFELPVGNEDKLIWLLFEGINYKADVWLNGNLLGSIHGAFVRGKFDVTDFVNTSESNILAVHIFPPDNPGIPHEQSPTAGRGPNGGQLCLDGPTFISSEGWDWVPGIRDRNIGIWQDVKIKYTDQVTLGDPLVITDLPLPDTTSADVTIQTELINHSDSLQRVKVHCRFDDISLVKSVVLKPNEHKQVKFSPNQYWELSLNNPKLWWPNGYGEPNLYKLNLIVENSIGKESDRKSLQFGIRELSYELTIDAPDKPAWRVQFSPLNLLGQKKPLFDNRKRRDVGDGVSIPTLREGADESVLVPVDDEKAAPYLIIKVNGIPIFCKGGNWGMDDAMKNVSRDHLEPYFKLHQEANFNMVRNWTGESTEEVFYELCDEYGLLVWNDFWLSTEGYNLNVNDDELFMRNARDVVRRFRNHPSIAIWCPRNEGYAPETLEDRLAELIVEEDGTRHYQPNSRYLNLRPSGPWHYFKDPADYYRNNAKGFNTEQGTPSVPTAASVRKMMAEEDTWPISDVWYYHDLHYGQQEYCSAIDHLYGDSENLDDFCKKAQMVNYDSHRAMFESWNSKLWNNTTGLLLWMTHPAWPSMVWQVYSWDYETFGSYYGCQKACEPIHVQRNLNDGKVVVINTSIQNVENASVSCEVYDLQGEKLFSKSTIVDVFSNQLTECFTPVFPKKLVGNYLVRLILKDNRGQIISLNDYWEKGFGKDDFEDFNELHEAKIKAKIVKESESPDLIKVRLKNTGNTIALSIKLSLNNENTNKQILPAYFSEGYFNLLPGESRTIEIEHLRNDSFNVAAEGYNLKLNKIL
ncbi:glycoside hydrolase family 2 protein [Sunxiuqinia sp. A32]|uniref:glycoside hydrolase family 2 protein n=1 Tax=Sunxiuqinia sp. A32 TaxID=3461496 RepID=UPI0040459176